MASNSRLKYLFIFLPLLITISCESQQKKYNSPTGYDFNNPIKYVLKNDLREISGISFYQGKKDTLYAEEDENGRLYHFKLGDSHYQITRFWKKGDYEDLAICRNFVIMLRSDGTLFTFPLAEASKAETDKTRVFEGLLPEGEYEGLSADEQSGKIYVLCKHCREEKTNKWGGGSVLHMDTAGMLANDGNFEINVKDLEAMEGIKKINFHPSALTRKSDTREWFILSSVNRLLVVTDEEWKIKAVYPLDPTLFPQPEGIAFDSTWNLYISNERNQATSATLILFPHITNR